MKIKSASVRVPVLREIEDLKTPWVRSGNGPTAGFKPFRQISRIDTDEKFIPADGTPNAGCCGIQRV
jgi:hypothetical protein